MAAVVEIDESNGGTEVVTHAVASLVMGTLDQTGLVAGVGGGKQPIPSNGMAKALRFHLTALGGGLGIAGCRVFCDPGVSGWSLWSNCSDVAGSYATSKVTTYAPPSALTGPVPYALPVADPGGPNLGIAGDLAGQLFAAGWSDYAYLQLRAAVGTGASFTAPCYFAYDDIG